jgi:starch phosphorylase
MLLAQELVQGIDLWSNTPRRPWEACGTSGMKVLVNGGLNLSELDGWWAEAYSPEVGWALGDGHEHGEDPEWDDAGAEALYALLEREVIPEFYERNEKGMPSKWLERIPESKARLTPESSATRAIREYSDNHYLPAASGYHERAAGDSALGVGLLHWQQDIDHRWNTVRFGTVGVETHDGEHFFQVKVYPGALNSDQLRVERYADSVQAGEPVLTVMTAHEPRAASSDELIYFAHVSATRPASDYTARIIPHHPSASVPLDAGQILWQR